MNPDVQRPVYRLLEIRGFRGLHVGLTKKHELLSSFADRCTSRTSVTAATRPATVER